MALAEADLRLFKKANSEVVSFSFVMALLNLPTIEMAMLSIAGQPLTTC